MATWPADWTERTLGSFAEARGGTGFPIALQGRSAGQLPFYKVSDMNADGNSTWMRRANNYISEAELRELGGRAFKAKTIAFPKIGATIYTNKKRILASAAVVDNNVMGVTVTDDVACLPEFLFFWFQHIELATLSSPGTVPSITSTRVKAQKVILPPREEQRQIAAVLSAVQRAIERQERLIALTAELKKALMHKLFTEGTRGEPQKQTEIGPVPESWRVDRLDRAGDVIYGIQAAVANNTKPVGTRILTNKNIDLDGNIIVEKQSYFELKTERHRKTLLKKGDILFNWRSGSKEHVGKTAFFDLEGQWTHSSFILRIRPREEVNGRFLFHYLTWLRESKYFVKLHSYAVNAKFNKSAINALPTVLPNRPEQDMIAAALDAVIRKVNVHAAGRAIWDRLFRTLLYQLMTAQIRVHDLDLSALDEAAQPAGAA
jgi:type I restriction enzyme S subunit